MENLNKVISSFDVQKTLQPKIWTEENEKINPKVRENLLEIAYQFIDSFGLDVVIDDIIITGSIANYNWSEYSDIDVHILVDYKQFSPQFKDMYVEFFDLKKIVFNQKRNVKIFGFDVELFVEDTDMKGVSGGVYSIMNDEWIKKPTKESVKISKEEIIKGAKKWMSIIDTLIKNSDDEDVEGIRNSVKDLKNKLKKFRLSGLKKGGELGLQNLVFKVLRRNGYIDKLYSIPLEKIDKKLSLKEAQLSAPLKNMEVGARFGVVRKGLDVKRPHSGTDFRARTGTPIYSPADGKVVKADMGENGGCGGSVFIEHSDGLESRFCHCSKIMVSVGDMVKRGEEVALTGGDEGDPGRGFSTGAHLHYTLVKNEELVDPMDYIGKPLTISQAKQVILPSDNTISKITKILKKPEFKNIDFKKLNSRKQNLPFIYEIAKLISNKTKLGKSQIDSSQRDVVTLQKTLKVLGYTKNNFKITGIFDNETEEAVKLFQRDNDLNVSGKIDTEMFKILYVLLLVNNINQSEIDKLEPYKISEKDIPDLIIYQEILNNLDVPITNQNLRFLFALRNVLGTFSAKNNPFNVKFDLEDDNKKTKVQGTDIFNYSTPQLGIKATIKTLELPKYKCVVDGMRQSKSVEEILFCPILQNLGIQESMVSLLKNDILIPMKILT
jgi:murein DD-endopeptidase MepM/ murein hydrolase activator NlpD/peptidoglycan hydrolase-like protein with peptidoglycan-binding domain